MKTNFLCPIIKTLTTLALLASVSVAQLPVNTLYGNEATEGFVSMFDGTRSNFVSNWVDYQKGNPNTTTLNSSWAFHDATKSMLCDACQINIRSKLIFKDVDFRFQYKCSGNQGVFYRSLIDYVTNYDSGVEFSVDDNTSQDPSQGGGNLDTRAGAAYGLYGTLDLAAYHHFDDADPWNECRIVTIGDSVQHWMNGKLVVAYRYFSDDFFEKYNKSKWGGGKTMGFARQGDVSKGPILEGYLGWQGDHGGSFYIRNLRVNTKPAWTAKYQWPLGATAVEKNKVIDNVNLKIQTTAQNIQIQFSEGGVRAASLLTLAGEIVESGKLSGSFDLVFSKPTQKGIYLISYSNKNGVVKTSKINLLN